MNNTSDDDLLMRGEAFFNRPEKFTRVVRS